jgi:hypothetical protein
MNDTSHMINEEAAAKAFSKQAPLFDELYAGDIIIQYKRKRVRDHIQYLWRFSIIELNAGPGTTHLCTPGYNVMPPIFRDHKTCSRKIRLNLEGNISYELCSFTELKNLFNRGPYDAIFSNFAGLNCTAELSKVLHSFDNLLKPGGIVTLVLLPKFSLWEFMMLFRGKFRTAFRRFSGPKGSKAHIEGEFFRCWYYNPSFVKHHLNDSFDLLSLEGLCALVPPSYIEKFAERHAGTFNFLKKKEDKWKSKWPWKNIGDYYIISFRKKH